MTFHRTVQRRVVCEKRWLYLINAIRFAKKHGLNHVSGTSNLVFKDVFLLAIRGRKLLLFYSYEFDVEYR